MKFLRWFSLTVIVGVGILVGFLYLMTIYGSPRKQVAYFTHTLLSDETLIDRHSVVDVFGLDGPEYYFELTLSAEDKIRLIQSFKRVENGDKSRSASELVPSSWKPSKTVNLEHYGGFDNATGTYQYLDVNPSSGKAWLVVYTI